MSSLVTAVVCFAITATTGFGAQSSPHRGLLRAGDSCHNPPAGAHWLCVGDGFYAPPTGWSCFVQGGGKNPRGGDLNCLTNPYPPDAWADLSRKYITVNSPVPPRKIGKGDWRFFLPLAVQRNTH
jgi:hypothetical protein